MTGTESLHVTFEMCSDPLNLPLVRATVGQLAALVGWDEAATLAITMAADEALANVIRHAYHGRTDGRIELHCYASAGELRFEMRDRGDPPDLSRICSRQVGCDQIGGLGTHVIRDVMDTVSYKETAEGNLFTATKRLRRQE
ncbi:MAG TPA: ATP-binding protein [Candidatus Sulfopaludibacter sp.]|jgi:anti-sigma regulatory factor (Ser/Thr protein kinase)|nr:ATP-binding protein [Candidatus Sulfopaludibacter sp.]